MGSSASLKIEKRGDDVYLALALPDGRLADGERRLRMAAATVRRGIRKVSGVEIDGHSEMLLFRFSDPNRKAADALVARLRSQVDAIFGAPLTPKEVDRVLDISPSERLRWYKDGRLPNCGIAVIGRGAHKIRFPVFPVDAITSLASKPQLIEKWRSDDRIVDERS